MPAETSKKPSSSRAGEHHPYKTRPPSLSQARSIPKPVSKPTTDGSIMEGLIPFVYKAIKERRSRSYSRCGSSSAVADEDDVWEQQKQQWAPAADGAGREQAGHRRHRSLEELAGEVGAAAPEWPARGAMRRGRSARIFSCIGGM
ncbi:hypothetical protein D1007_14380 [Hordeum vulgare]|nr:uncharacterized protein LOC123440623 [Hordeum vulgare subsp. vulgare]KAE8808960.1 hypothetical protein D1007_14380 [Hordeum vulgare]